jgi:hypothetical protein
MRNQRIHCRSMNRGSGLEVGDESGTSGGGIRTHQHSRATPSKAGRNP